ncbi:hypothetical protein BDN67DRAFT_961632 [Paxillus ammoniavirescens]|nr:hypothetical protein BDN67DRAFT_961632 [Paxillus ammoniavirescens]
MSQTVPVVKSHGLSLTNASAFSNLLHRSLFWITPPAYILVKLYRTKAAQLEGLEKDELNFHLYRQLPLTAAYAFTDYRAQGKTINPVIVDIGTPFNVYVALSRRSGLLNICALKTKG